MKVNSGNDAQALQMASQLGFTGTSTGVTATTLTSSGFTASAYIGQVVVTGATYGVIVSNTTTVLTVDRWYNPANPGGAAATTPGTGTFVIVPGGAPAFFTALTTNATAPAATDTTLATEITTAGGGLIRKSSTYAHTGGANSYTLTTTFTVNGSDTGLPVTIAKIGVFNSLTSGTMVFETLLSATATLSAVGDALTTTHTVTT